MNRWAKIHHMDKITLESRGTPEPHITVAEAAKLAGLTRQRIHQLVKARGIASRLLAGQTWVPVQEIETLLEERRVE